MTKREGLIGFDLLEEQYAITNAEQLSAASDEELLKRYKKADDLYWFYMIMQVVAKELCNSVYGGFGTPSLRYYNYDVARDITGEGAHACQIMEKTGQSYFRDLWPNDHKWHDELREKFPHFMKADTVPQSITKDIIVTCDTDSVDKLTQIHIENLHGTKTTVSIEYLFEQLSTISYISTSNVEHAKTNYKIMNWSNDQGFYYDDPLAIIRHKVSKDKWELKTKNGLIIQTTSDHSLIGFSDERGKHSLKPNEVSKDTQILTLNLDGEEEFVDIEYCKCIGKYEDEYVYDVSMPTKIGFDGEDLQTFVGNNILIHNSNYVTFDYVFESIGLNPEEVDSRQAVDFIVYFMKTRLDPIYASVLDKLINGRNGQNTMVFELEAIGGFGIFVARKKYVYAKLWQDGKYIGDQNKLKVTGIELKQRSAPKEIKKIMTSFINTIFIKKGKIEADLFFAMCKSVKDDLMQVAIPQLAKSTKLNKYDDYVIEDFPKVKLRSKTGLTIQGAANYNNLIKSNNLQSKYPLLKNGMGVKVFYDTMGRAFAYPIEYGYPEDLIPKMDKAKQIEKILFSPIRRLTEGMIKGDTKRMGDEHIQHGLSAIMAKFKKK